MRKILRTSVLTFAILSIGLEPLYAPPPGQVALALIPNAEAMHHAMEQREQREQRKEKGESDTPLVDCIVALLKLPFGLFFNNCWIPGGARSCEDGWCTYPWTTGVGHCVTCDKFNNHARLSVDNCQPKAPGGVLDCLVGISLSPIGLLSYGTGLCGQLVHDECKKPIQRKDILAETLVSEEQRVLHQRSIIDRPAVSDIVIPEIEKRYEDIYRRFFMGKLIYKPNPKSDQGRIELPIRALANPLEGTFDLSQCGNTGRYVSISTGYRKGKKAQNANKLEVWIVPRFLIEKDLSSHAAHFKPIMKDWNAEEAPVGLFLTWGAWDKLGWYDSTTCFSLEDLGDKDLRSFVSRCGSNVNPHPTRKAYLLEEHHTTPPGAIKAGKLLSNFFFELKSDGSESAKSTSVATAVEIAENVDGAEDAARRLPLSHAKDQENEEAM